jgi:transcriptional regulator GlxA family with amidase domain
MFETFRPNMPTSPKPSCCALAERPLRIAVIAFDRISPFHLAVPCVVFGDPHPGAPRFELRVCSAEARVLHTTVGFAVTARHGLASLRWADLVIVPSWRDPDERPPAALLKALVVAHRRGARIVGLCLGAYVLAEAGLLDGRGATTHWSVADDFARRYPAVRVNAGVLYVDEDDVVTSAGTAAGLDCCLYLLRQQHGAEAANRVARRLVVSPHRQGGQAQFVQQPVPRTQGDSRLGTLLDELRMSLAAPHTLDSMAERSLMSRRTFTRRFRQITGTTPMHWLIAERLAAAQILLETTEQSVERIAERVGFDSSTVLRQRFRQSFGLSPTAWRHGFSRAGSAPQS